MPTIFLKLWENEEGTILRILTVPFSDKKFPGAPGVNTGDILGQIVDEPYQVYMCGVKQIFLGLQGPKREIFCSQIADGP